MRDQDRIRTMLIDTFIIVDPKKHLEGRRSGYLFQARNGAQLRLSNVREGKLYPILKELKLIQPGI